MKKIFPLVLLAIVTLSCTKTKLSTPESLQVNNFIYKGLNNYYLWQDKVPNLADTRFLNNKEYNVFLESEGNSSQFFYNLLYQRGVIDKWSWIVDDYIALEQSFQGTNKNNWNGIWLGTLLKTLLLNYLVMSVMWFLILMLLLKYVARGMLFNQVNGTQLN